jgi:hypothetical protein
MNFIKKRLFLIICILVVLLGIGVFLSGMMVASDNRKEIESIRTKVKSVEPLSSKVVRDNEFTQIEENTKLAKNDRNTVQSLAWQTTDRPLIYNDVFPALVNENDRIYYYRVFADKYCSLIDRFLGDLNAGDSPSDAEEEKVREDYKKSISSSGTRGYSPREREAENIEILLDNLRLERSKQVAIYATRDSFCGYDHWKLKPMGDKRTMLIDSWYTQIAAWIQEDVVQAVIQINDASPSVSGSAVKRLIEISFGGLSAASTPTETTATSRSVTKGGAARRYSDSEYNLPAYVTKSKAQRSEYDVVKGEIVSSFTKRTCDDLVHVVQFEVAVVIDSTRITDFINTLQSEKYTFAPQSDGTISKQNKRNQITVIQINVEPINLDAEKDAGYYYGPASLKVLRLVGEYIFFSQGYQHNMPQPLEEIIKPAQAETATPGLSDMGI